MLGSELTIIHRTQKRDAGKHFRFFAEWKNMINFANLQRKVASKRFVCHAQLYCSIQRMIN